MTLENPLDNQQPRPHANNEVSKQGEQPKPEIPLGAAQSQSEPAKKCGHETRHAERDWIDKATLGLEAFGLFVLIIYTIFTGWQAITANSTLTEIKTSKVDTQQLIDAAGKQAKAASDFALQAKGINEQTRAAVREFERLASSSDKSIAATRKAADKALQASIEASRLDQRAWVKPAVSY